MPAEDRLAQAAEIIWTHWRKGSVTVSLPDELKPRDWREAYAIQAHLEPRSSAPLWGWKIAATSAMGQAHIGVDRPLAGRLLAECIVADGGEVPAVANRMAVGEPEFAFRMAADLPPRPAPYTVEEVLAAVASLHPGIEIPDSRFTDFATVGGLQLVADNACAHWFVLGPATSADWRSLDLSTHRVLARVEGKLEREGIGENVLGDPRKALTWLANELSGLGVTLRAGQVVTTGTCALPFEIAPGDRVSADFGVLGTVSVRIG